jgi:hypothetical protein
MPWSYGNDAKRKALALLSTRRGIRGVLDLGAGAGTWRKMAREFVIGGSKWTAVEAHAPYAQEFNLSKLYPHVIVNDLRMIKYGRYPGFVFIFGDVLEHLERAQAIDVVKRASSMGTVAVMMPFHPTASANQGASNGVEWERHRHIWHWEEWLDALRTLGLTPELVEVPPGDERNKGVTICWHASHTVWPYWEERKNLGYYAHVQSIIGRFSPGESILDVGCWDTPVATWGSFKRRYTCDLAVNPRLPNVTSHVGDFTTWDLPERMSLTTCLQTIEHLRNGTVHKFTEKLRGSADRVIVSVPYMWRKGKEYSHVQDPIDLTKLTGLFNGEAPSEHVVINNRLVAVWT